MTETRETGSQANHSAHTVTAPTGNQAEKEVVVGRLRRVRAKLLQKNNTFAIT
jgi:hypothetical protein